MFLSVETFLFSFRLNHSKVTAGVVVTCKKQKRKMEITSEIKYVYKKGRCKKCDQGLRPNTASGTNHLMCNDVSPSRETCDRCPNVFTHEDFNLMWDTEPNDLKSYILNEEVFDMKCNQCLAFIGTYPHPADCNQNFCHNCGNKIKRAI